MWLLPRGKQPVNHFEEDSEMVTESIKTLTELVQNPSVENTSVPGTMRLRSWSPILETPYLSCLTYSIFLGLHLFNKPLQYL